MADIDYYADSSQHGNYQYVTIQEIINNYLLSRDDDDYTSSSNRAKLLYHAYRGVRELTYDTLKEVQGIELELSPSLTVTLPPDYVNYVRISWVDDKGQLHPMAADNKMSIAKEYLQAHDYSLLFDNNGCVLIGNSYRAPEDPAFDPNTDLDSEYGYRYGFCPVPNYDPNKDMSRVFPNGKFRIDKSQGVIQFSSNVESKNIVLEYISDGLYQGCEGLPEEELRIHKFAEGALMDFIHYEAVKNRRNVPLNEKVRARKEYHASRRIAQLRINALRKDEVLQYFKGQSKVIK